MIAGFVNRLPKSSPPKLGTPGEKKIICKENNIMARDPINYITVNSNTDHDLGASS